MSADKTISLPAAAADPALAARGLSLVEPRRRPHGQPPGRMATAMGLRRELGLLSLTSIVVANMIGAGALTLAGFLLTELRNPMLMLALWLAGGVTALCGAVCYGELAAAMPMAGGEYVYLSRLFHPSLGFLSGWISFLVGFSAPIAAAALALVEYATRAFPALLGSDALPGSGAAVVLKKLYAVAVIFLGTWLHRRGVRIGARVQNGLTFVKIAGIILFVAAGFAFGRGSLSHLSQGRGLSLGFAQCKSIGLSFLWIMFAYSGWNASAYIGSEASSPRKNLPRSLLLGAALVAVLYLALNLLVVFAIPAGEPVRTPAIVVSSKQYLNGLPHMPTIMWKMRTVNANRRRLWLDTEGRFSHTK
jgi:APA family basic amino acid/polyamine antiporter